MGEEGRKRRLGFGKKGKSSFTVHRSEEVLPPEDTVGGRSGRQPSSASSDGEGSGDGDRSDLLSLSRPPLFFISLSLYFPHYFRIDAGAVDNGRSKEIFTSHAARVALIIASNPCVFVTEFFERLREDHYVAEYDECA